MGESDNHVGVASALRRNALAMLIAAGATVVVQLGTYFIVGEVALALLVAFGWVVIAAPVFAAGGRSVIDALLRGGAVIDASVVVLIVSAAAGPALGPVGAIKIYLIFCSVALAGCSLVLLGRNVISRHILSVVAVLLILVVAAGPFWANGIITSASAPWRERIAFGVRACNPVFSTIKCLNVGYGFVWSEKPILYEHTVLGRDVPDQSAGWYVTVGVYASLAVALGAVVYVRRRAGDG
jgi:hypothetical protein